jgi:UDP-3-O-[3-hydroxymyristoyl] N-acetylglucosamine deacetylase
MNANALKALMSDPTAYEIVETATRRQRVTPREVIAVNAP